MSLTIIGLGPGVWGQLTVEAASVLDSALEICLRTEAHPLAQALHQRARVHSFDNLFRTGTGLEQMRLSLVEQVVRLAEGDEETVYAVPGHPLLGESTVPSILLECRRRGISTSVIGGVSIAEAPLSCLEASASKGLQVCDVLQADVDPALPAIVGHLHHQRLASLLKDTLLSRYAADHPLTLVGLPAAAEGTVIRLQLNELGEVPLPTPFCCLYVPPLSPEKNLSSFAALKHIVGRLRAPDGCPWDRKQTHASIKTYLLEETYEAIQALDEENPAKVCEELGDLMLQIMLHAQLAAEAGRFDISDVLRGIGAKLIHRHPHVFGDCPMPELEEVELTWEVLKQEERAETSSLLSSVPRTLPALSYTQAVQRRAAQVGFDWEQFRGVLDKVAEELGELERAQNYQERLWEFGDLLFALANAARWLGVDPEEALRLANRRFYQRFSLMESLCRERDTFLRHLSLQQLDQLWEEAKRQLGGVS
ncbi:nucleoside triphosphate pyrophosphohydrolase [Chloroflexota bacterium]